MAPMEPNGYTTTFNRLIKEMLADQPQDFLEKTSFGKGLTEEDRRRREQREQERAERDAEKRAGSEGADFKFEDLGNTDEIEKTGRRVILPYYNKHKDFYNQWDTERTKEKIMKDEDGNIIYDKGRPRKETWTLRTKIKFDDFYRQTVSKVADSVSQWEVFYKAGTILQSEYLQATTDVGLAGFSVGRQFVERLNMFKQKPRPANSIRTLDVISHGDGNGLWMVHRWEENQEGTKITKLILNGIYAEEGSYIPQINEFTAYLGDCKAREIASNEPDEMKETWNKRQETYKVERDLSNGAILEGNSQRDNAKGNNNRLNYKVFKDVCRIELHGCGTAGKVVNDKNYKGFVLSPLNKVLTDKHNIKHAFVISHLDKSGPDKNGDFRHNTRVVCYRKCVIAVLYGYDITDDLGVEGNITIKTNYRGAVSFKDLFAFREAFIKNNKENPILLNNFK